MHGSVSRRAAISQMAIMTLLASTSCCPQAIAQEGRPKPLEGDVKAAVMQAFKKAADKGKVCPSACPACICGIIHM